ncbi:hypothetical protein [Mesorhizobium sp. M2E.F.Ca.ET.219.01.1.1]|uniref:hypothetical protein n=1 Tax=Mesorhizobium sp. M2E.F.Ca.ET.219.01.1.1 TaxID=2500530 RepID=UPI000FD830F7|nr:hypothetical protein [Mesorhizobium sp. M2E.F.Ca.ET.219.01.1.1]TGQ05651.1 hypothetical protein EN862_029840 [Mesorhizobium sp. M2E.F.Ca.ET.219.01.1.1]
MVGWASKQVIVGTTLSTVLAALMGCTSMLPPGPEPTPVAARPQAKVVRTTTPKVVKQQKVTAKKLIKPVNETPPVVAPLGGGGGGGGGGGWG